jgi:polar amino acid transport system permease protein
MPDERTRNEQNFASHLGSPSEPGDELEPPGRVERFIAWAAGLPWWAIILAAVAVFALYSMLSSVIYRDVIRSLTDDPQTSTDNLFTVVEIVGEPTMIVGTYSGETTDSIQTVVNSLLGSVIKSSTVTQAGFITGETPATITVQTDTGTITIPKDQITQEERSADGKQITLTYINRVTVTGTLTKRTGKTWTVRTVSEQRETFDTSRIISRTVVPCTPADGPNCKEGDKVTLQRRGEVLTGTLTTLSGTTLSIQLPDGSSREVRQSDIDYFYVPTLTVAVNASRSTQPVQPGDEVRIGFVEGTDITTALATLKSLNDIPVPLIYADGQARVTLVSYPDVDSLLAATGSGEVSALVYLDSGPNRLVIDQWVKDHPDAGVVLPTPPRACSYDCTVTVKVKDDEITGRIAQETPEQVTLVTVEPEYVVIDRSRIIENRRMEPGTCALNNLRGCNAGIFLTLRVTFQAYALALLLGLFFGLMRVQNNPVLYAFSTLYVEVIRGIPLLVILLYAGFVVSPWLRDNTPLKLSDEQEAVLGLAFGYGAFVAEIFRAGIQSVSRGQTEAARSLGMSYPQAMRFVVLPQAVRVVLPPLGNDFISMLKDSALISVLALPDLLQLGRLYVSRTYRAFAGYNTVAVLYLLMTIFLSMLVRVIERRSQLPK